ncbi:MAG: SDR family NAD(P)-dependent oxidoreductase, partial [Pseudomonadota bacterium]
EDRARLLEAVAELPVDLLINNAGLAHFGDLQDNPLEHERAMVEVNCLAPVLLTRALLPGMLTRCEAERRRGAVILLASTAAFFTLPRLTTYSASKAFDLHFAQGLAGELADRPINVLALCPGPTRTAFFRRAGLSDMGMLARHSPEQVVREGMAALGKRTVQVVGGRNRLAAMTTRLVPQPLMMRVGVEWSKRRKRREAAAQ